MVGDAGRGKSHLAAELTSPAGDLAAGVFIPGSHLREGDPLDALVVRQAGLPAGSFDELLEACDAGARLGQRIPVVIDGLNEAQRPEQWRELLASLAPALTQWENVALILTLRGDVVTDDVTELELEWSQLEVEELLARYFERYRIETRGARLPMWLFSEPLFVSMFCEAANHERAEPAGIESLPTTMVGVFELYRHEMAERLRQRAGHPALPAGHIQRKLASLAARLWVSATYDGAAQTLQGEVPVESIQVDMPPLRGHLLSPEFFDAERHPAIKFESRSVDLADDGRVTVDGELTINGLTKSVTATGTMVKPAIDIQGGRRFGVELTTTIDRRDYGLNRNAELPGGNLAVDWDVALEASLEFTENSSD